MPLTWQGTHDSDRLYVVLAQNLSQFLRVVHRVELRTADNHPLQLMPRCEIQRRRLGSFLQCANCAIFPTVASILEFADGVSGDVQELCEALWETSEEGAEIVQDGIRQALDLIFSRERGGYEVFCERLTAGQSAVLRALASEPNARPYSIEFVSKVSMPTSSIRRIISKLVDQRIIYPSKGAYRFSNPFFREWLLVQ